MTFRIRETDRVKMCKAPGYRYIFDKETGDFARWGATSDDDPEMAPHPEILDIEIATACDGVSGAPCRFCYKANKRQGMQMSFETYERLFAILPRTVTQIAFGLGSLQPANAPMWRIFQHTRDNGVIPNVTINGWQLTEELADKLVGVMGAVAVSRYDPKGVCYDAVKMLTDRGLRQTNIHQLVSAESYDGCMEVLEDMQTDPRLQDMNAVVFLMLKPKGRGSVLTPLRDPVKYKALVDYALENNLRVGFDSCSVPSFLSAVQDHPRYEGFEQETDRCESGLFSLYIDAEGKAWPCSFGQKREDLEPIDLLQVQDFEREVWHGPQLQRWRQRLLGNCRSCPLWDIDILQENTS